MKKTIVVLAFLIVSSATFAQVKIRPGIKLGLNSSRLQGADSSGSKIGLNGGLFVNFDLSRFYELQIETGYSEQGAKIKREYSSFGNNDGVFYRETVEEDVSIQYFTFGIANKFFVMAKDHGFHFIVGPGIDVRVGDNSSINIAAIDFSFFGGIGYEFQNGLTIEARYKQGIVDVNYDDGYNTNNGYYDNYDSYFTNSVFQLSAAYKFKF